MVHLLPNPLRVSSHLRQDPPRTAVRARAKSGTGRYEILRNGGIKVRLAVVVRCSSDYSSPIAAAIGTSEEIEISNENAYLAAEFGWKVRKLIEEEDDLRTVARIQAEAFHEPVLLFNHFFFQFFQAEVLSALIYRLKSYPPDRYACLVAEPESENCKDEYNFVGVVDVTVAGDLKVRRLLPAGVKEYLFVTGIAVDQTARRRKVATALLKGCDMLAKVWGFKFLALSAYEDDYGARNLYSKAGYQVLYVDPLWKSSWIGRKRCVTMVKQL
ncbi:hypothetical protein SDJN02_13877 [Cucurbita argyrosperma subsp. argyrosperma]|uniref:Uncharacterized protein LOC111443273 n=1 Tax=Cucurbita moschata TaxID=3662 RepID=A0A6J1F9A7_CUCMO|nr:uncharacterized protein LOC111443273 [Cucurbita moschata]KAG7025054.1 hypothetical protein SDJN02_13877 [Cucurbita argyrosperma subsp. argyrosperma]